MTDDVNGVVIDERRRSKGRGRGISSLRPTKDADTKVASSTQKEKETKYADDAKEEKLTYDENSKQRGTKVRKTKAGYEPYQVKKNRPINTTINSDSNKSLSSGEREHKPPTQSPSQKRSNSGSWRHDHYSKGSEKYHDKNYEQRGGQTNYDQKSQSQNKARSSSYQNNKRNNYRTYTNKEKQKQSRRKRGGNENITPNNDRINNRKNIMHESGGDVGGLQDKTNITKHFNDPLVTTYKSDIKYRSHDTELKHIEATYNNKYIDIEHENKARLSLSLSNSEPEILYVKDIEYDKSDVLGNVDLDMEHEHNNTSDIQTYIIDSPSEVESISAEVGNLSMEEMKIIKEMDNKRRVQGIGILECPCSLSLDGERIGFCDAHELIAEHNETIANTTLSSEATANSSLLLNNDSFNDIKTADDTTDPIDEIYLTISPIRRRGDVEELESNPPSDEDTDIDGGTVEGFNNTDYNMASSYISGTDSYSYSEEFPSPITLETSRNIDIENINALFMNLGRRQSYNSFNSSSYDSKINSSCEKTWRSMDDFSPVDFHAFSRKSLVMSVSSGSSDEAINCDTGSDNKYEAEIPASNSMTKSDTSLLYGSSFGRSSVQSSDDSSKTVSHPNSYPSLCNKKKSPATEPFSVGHFMSNLNREKKVSSDNYLPDTVDVERRDSNECVITAVVSSSDVNKDVNINININIHDENKERKKLFYSYSQDSNMTDTCRYTEGRNGRSSDENVSRRSTSKDSCYIVDKDDHDSQDVVIVDDKETWNEDKNMTDSQTIESSNCDSISVASDANEAHDNDGQTMDQNDDDYQKQLDQLIGSPVNVSVNFDSVTSSCTTNNANNAKIAEDKTCEKSTRKDTAGVIMLPNSQFTGKYRESTPEKPDRFNLSNIPQDQSSRRHVRFSPQTSDSRFSSTSVKHEDDSYMVREYMNIIKDKQFQLKKLLQRGFQSLESVNVMLEMSEAIQQKFGELIVHNQEYSFRHNFENFLWKLAFYSIIAKFRAFLEDQDVPHHAIQKIGVLYWDFLQNGIQFLDSIIVQLQKQAHFDLNDYLKDPIRIGNCNKQVKYALRSCHLLLIFMGDLERYVSQFLQQEDYRNAKKYYKEAQILTPKNGKSYNQLAVVAVVTKYKLDAVYYYARSLQVSIPFLTAKDRLTAIFQEIQKKASKLKQERKLSHGEAGGPQNHLPKPTMDSNFIKRNIDHLRDEVWIFYRNKQMFKVMLTDQNQIIDLTPNVILNDKLQQTEVQKHSKLSLKEINRSYMILFLFVHCKLYTNIGLEEFTYVHQESLSDLSTLLRYPKASSIRKENLLKCIVINIFSVHNIMEKNGHEDLIPNTGLDLAIIFGMDMIAVLCAHCVHLFNSLFNSKQGITVADQFLPAIRVWILWLITHSELVRKSTACAMFDIWSDICDFFNKIHSLPLEKDIIFNSEGDENVYLEEDLLLAGLKSLNNSLIYCTPPKGKEAETVGQLRLENLRDLTKRLHDCGNLPFGYNDEEGIYKPVLASITSSSPVKKVKVLDVEDEVEVLADVIIEDDDEEYGDMSHVDELKAQKASLTKQIQEKEFEREAAMEVLESHRLQGRHLSENSPTYVVADTNCYIDHLNHLVTILMSKDFIIIVPLIVINELDGLQKGSYFDERMFAEHRRKIQESARLAVDFLEDQFSRSNTNIRAITSSGTELDTIAFRVEEFSDDRGTNDDVILSCCLRYCKEHKVHTEDDTNVIRREVVLLTSDRNLRVKSHTRVLPTLDITTFVRMAKFT